MLDQETAEIVTALKDAVGILTANTLKAEGADAIEEAADKYLDVARAAGGIAGVLFHAGGKLRAWDGPGPPEEAGE